MTWNSDITGVLVGVLLITAFIVAVAAVEKYRLEKLQRERLAERLTNVLRFTQHGEVVTEEEWPARR